MSMPAYIARRALTYAATSPTPASQPYALSQQFAAKKQLTYATTGFDLVRMDDAEDLGVFALPPADDGGAYRHVAYWLSVASRLMGGSSVLLTEAGKAAAWSTMYPVGSMSSSNAAHTMITAGNLVTSEIGRWITSLPTARANEARRVALKLTEYGQPTAITQAQKTDTGLMSYMRSFQEMSEAMGKLTALLGVGLGLGAIALIGWIVTKRRGT